MGADVYGLKTGYQAEKGLWEVVDLMGMSNNPDMETLAKLVSILAHESQHLNKIKEDGTTE
ncbi:MAG: hypothetical protein PF518_15545 [Spirochaetaceae bacterium]|nr:hypothetical protein [Spirochaetaceae bacterium]